ncbi:MAG: hypothetical protein WEF51_01090, partial [Chloroflexota bacterium]
GPGAAAALGLGAGLLVVAAGVFLHVMSAYRRAGQGDTTYATAPSAAQSAERSDEPEAQVRGRDAAPPFE